MNYPQPHSSTMIRGMGTALVALLLIGCEIPFRTMSAAEYMDRDVPSAPVGTTWVTPVGLRVTHRHWLQVDVLIEGDAKTVEHMAFLWSSAKSAPDDWIEITDGDGNPVELPGPQPQKMPIFGCGGDPAFFQTPLGGGRIRVVTSCDVRTSAAELEGAYRVRLRADNRDLRSFSQRAKFQIDTEWHELTVDRAGL